MNEYSNVEDKIFGFLFHLIIVMANIYGNYLLNFKVDLIGDFSNKKNSAVCVCMIYVIFAEFYFFFFWINYMH